MSPVRAGALRHVVTLERNDGTRQPGGEYPAAWVTEAANLPAEVRPLEGAERFRAMQVKGTISHEVEIRYRPGVTAGRHRFRLGTRVLNIAAAPIDVGERRERLVCVCEEVTR